MRSHPSRRTPVTRRGPAADALAVGVNLTGFFVLTQRAISEMLKRGSGHVVNITTTLADYANSSTPSVQIAGH
jgi:NAD(P)-dependent dehydrogenase (short-subunit alcohol dehydrogenase family)